MVHACVINEEIFFKKMTSTKKKFLHLPKSYKEDIKFIYIHKYYKKIQKYIIIINLYQLYNKTKKKI